MPKHRAEARRRRRKRSADLRLRDVEQVRREAAAAPQPTTYTTFDPADHREGVYR